MEYRRLGKSGLKLSALSLGSWTTFGSSVDARLARALMGAAYEAGVNFFDNAEGYAAGDSERVMGQALRALAWPRDSYCVSTKVFFGSVPEPRPNQRGLSRKHVLAACDQSLERLQLDFVDLYLCHRPDPETPLEETVRAMDDLIRQGKVLYWGTSEWPASSIAAACAFARQEHLALPAVEQPQYNLFVRRNVEQQLVPLYADPGIGLTTWSPLCSGLLTGKYKAGWTGDGRLAQPAFQWIRDELGTPAGQRRVAAARALEPLARGLGISMAALSIAWCLKNPAVTTVLLGARRVEQLEENLQALAALPLLTPAVMAQIAALAESDS